MEYNLMPYVTQVAKGNHVKLRVFGNDFPTVDGTGICANIYSCEDLAEVHVAALYNLTKGVHIYTGD